MSRILIPSALMMAASGLGLGLWTEPPGQSSLTLPTLVLLSAQAPCPITSDASGWIVLEEVQDEGQLNAIRLVRKSPDQDR